MLDLALVILISAVASARVWQLLATDGITWRLRNGVHRLDWAWLSDAWYCPYCSGLWYAFGTTTALLHVADAWSWTAWLLGSLAANQLAARWLVESID